MTADENMKKVMSEKKLDFDDVFDKATTNIYNDLPKNIFKNQDPDLVFKKLKEKRDFGLKKYGERSYQKSINNFMLCPLDKHLKEELIDAINYLLAIILKNNMLYNNSRVISYRYALENILSVYVILEEFENEEK